MALVCPAGRSAEISRLRQPAIDLPIPARQLGDAGGISVFGGQAGHHATGLGHGVVGAAADAAPSRVVPVPASCASRCARSSRDIYRTRGLAFSASTRWILDPAVSGVYLFGTPLGQVQTYFQQFTFGAPGALFLLLSTVIWVGAWDWLLTSVLVFLVVGTVLLMHQTRKRIQALSADFQRTETSSTALLTATRAAAARSRH